MAAGLLDSTNYFVFTPASFDVPLTMSCWLNSATLNTRVIFDVYSGSNYHRLLSNGTSGQIIARSFVFGGSFRDSTITAQTANTWHHVVGVFTSTTNRQVFVDGTSGTANTQSSNVGSLTVANIIPTFNGGHTLADVCLWDVALTQDEITSLAKGFAGNLIRPASLQFYAPLVRDFKNIKGTLSTGGTPTVEDHPPILGAIPA
jgi:hypothetical protein